MQDWRWMTAADLGRRIGSGEIDPVDLTKVFLTAIDEHEHRDRIYARVDTQTRLGRGLKLRLLVRKPVCGGLRWMG